MFVYTNTNSNLGTDARIRKNYQTCSIKAMQIFSTDKKLNFVTKFRFDDGGYRTGDVDDAVGVDGVEPERRDASGVTQLRHVRQEPSRQEALVRPQPGNDPRTSALHLPDHRAAHGPADHPDGQDLVGPGFECRLRFQDDEVCFTLMPILSYRLVPSC